jgi:hypothetical protein
MEYLDTLLYRKAYGLAADLAGSGGTVEAILAEVTRRLATGQQGEAEVIRGGVEDALAGRRPRW